MKQGTLFGLSRGGQGVTEAQITALRQAGIMKCKTYLDSTTSQWQYDCSDIAAQGFVPHFIFGAYAIPGVTPRTQAYQDWITSRLVDAIGRCKQPFAFVEFGSEVTVSPDGFWCSTPPCYKQDAVAQACFGIYQQVVAAVVAAELQTGVRCMVGGPGAASYDVPMRLAILCAKNQVRLDFVSWHHYTQYETPAGLAAAIRAIKAVTHADVYLSEFGASPSGDVAYNTSMRAVQDTQAVIRGADNLGIDEMCMLQAYAPDGSGWYNGTSLTPWAKAALDSRMIN